MPLQRRAFPANAFEDVSIEVSRSTPKIWYNRPPRKSIRLDKVKFSVAVLVAWLSHVQPFSLNLRPPLFVTLTLSSTSLKIDDALDHPFFIPAEFKEQLRHSTITQQ